MQGGGFPSLRQPQGLLRGPCAHPLRRAEAGGELPAQAARGRRAGARTMTAIDRRGRRDGSDLTPKLLSVLREGYGPAQLRADMVAGLTVAIVALPLSMAIAIASGVTPERGLYTAIVGGFLVSALGGSRHQVGGPAGAFIVLVAATVERHGLDGLLLATMLSGVFLAVGGLLRVGTYVRFIPFPVTVGFTAGIGAIIFASQVSALLGLTLAGPEPGPLLEKLPALWAALPTLNPAAMGVALGTVLLITTLRAVSPAIPGMLIAIVLGAAATALFGLPVETIGDRFGALPTMLPAPALPPVSLAKVQAVLPDAIAFALLGAIESLLSATVADGMTGRRHRSNGELLAQGAANVASGLFGGFCVTGTIARTATNVRAGAHGPVAGMLHAAFLLAFLMVAGPLAVHIPLAALAGVLAVVAWGMAERHAFAALLRGPRGDAVVLLATFLLTVFRDLTEAIIVGFGLGSALFIQRMSELTAVAPQNGDLEEEGETVPAARNVAVHRVTGALFFGAASVMDNVLDNIAEGCEALVIDLSAVAFLDSSGANGLGALARNAARRGLALYVAGATPAARAMLGGQGAHPPLVLFAEDVAAALADWRMRKAP
jgi:SulP family sulfate permease